MTFNIIGTGNMAWFLAAKLAAAGHTCICVYGRDIQKAEELAKTVHANSFKTLTDGVADDADCCIIAATDTAIGTIANQLSLEKGVLLHTAGAVGIDIVNTIKDRAVLWPVYSIIKNALPTHRQIPAVWEASSDKAKETVLAVAHSFTELIFEANKEQRAILHLTAVFSNNFTNHMMAIAAQICTDEQLPFSLLQPIILQTAERIKEHSPATLQTGPAKRGDDNTIEKHLQLLHGHKDWQKVYETITASIKNMYKSSKG